MPCSRVLTCRSQLIVRDFALIWVLTKDVSLHFKIPKFRIHSMCPTMCYMGKYSSATLQFFIKQNLPQIIAAIRMCACILSHFSSVQLFATLWTVAFQVPLSMEFSRQEYWSGLSCPPPGNLLNPRIEHTSPVSPALQADLYCWAPGGTWGYKNTYIKYNRVTNSSQEEFQ